MVFSSWENVFLLNSFTTNSPDLMNWLHLIAYPIWKSSFIQTKLCLTIHLLTCTFLLYLVKSIIGKTIAKQLTWNRLLTITTKQLPVICTWWSTIKQHMVCGFRDQHQTLNIWSDNNQKDLGHFCDIWPFYNVLLYIEQS